MMFVVVPDSLRDAINAKIDVALAEHPGAADQRETIYGVLLSYFNAHGVIPDFKLTKNEEPQS